MTIISGFLYVAMLLLSAAAVSGETTTAPSHRCPQACDCSSDDGTHVTVVCDRGGMSGSVPTGEMPAALVRQLRIVAPARGPPNHLTIGPLFHNFSSLLSLVVTNSGVPALGSRSFVGLIALQELDLSRNAVSHVSGEALVGVPALRSLSLADNRVESAPSGAFRHTASLRRLSLAGNRLAALQPRLFRGLSHLQALDLSGNPLSRLDDAVFWDVQELSELRCCGCLLVSLSSVPALPQLRLLDLSDNLLQQRTFPAAEASRLWPELRELSLAGNGLTSVPVTALPEHLGTMSLARNELAGLGALKLPSWLRELDLSTNPLASSAVTQLLQEERQLRNLSVAYTGLSEIPSSAIPAVLKLRLLDLRGNPWTCTECHAAPLLIATENADCTFVTIHWPTCHWPSSTDGLVLSSLRIEQLPPCEVYRINKNGGIFGDSETFAAVMGVSLLILAVALMVIAAGLYRRYYVAHYYTHEELHGPISNSSPEFADDTNYNLYWPLVSSNNMSSIEKLSSFNGNGNFITVS
ncbi:insulin-like growth factor-binding protein complex acid labile subunit [Schistocerca serialis cubense]|uniref:insulin-like growth factor-binding protein complex acid labile subunit n=1 Tax=Schistocerca serialis cubense TaxID=2023355 RepID=UPI00214E20E9|nr:insulin-like growth factor-binding protein complex acid labile subunit [Schistocerca serialis cubense]